MFEHCIARIKCLLIADEFLFQQLRRLMIQYSNMKIYEKWRVFSVQYCTEDSVISQSYPFINNFEIFNQWMIISQWLLSSAEGFDNKKVFSWHRYNLVEFTKKHCDGTFLNLTHKKKKKKEWNLLVVMLVISNNFYYYI